MRKRWLFTLPLPLWAPEDGGAAPPAEGTPATPPAGEGAPPPAAAKWFEGSDALSDDDRKWLTGKGLTVEDPAQAAMKAVKGWQAAEKYIGKGVDKILERPAEGQDWSDWARANAAALGLPESAEAYDLTAPEGWPKDLPWDADFEGKFRELAFKTGMSPAMAKAAVGIYAEKIQAMTADIQQEYQKANAKMMADLERDYGDKAPRVVARAKLGAQAIAEKAGFDADALAAITNRITMDAGGDAMAIKFMAAIGEMMGEDTAIGLGAGGGGGTLADAQAALAAFTAKDSDFAKAVASSDHVALARLRPQYDALAKAVADKMGK